MFKPNVVDKIATHILCSIIFFFEDSEVYEIMWKNSVQPDRPQMRKRHMCIAYWMPQATNTDSEYVTITAFPLQQWLHHRASILRYTYISSLVFILSLRKHSYYFKDCQITGHYR